MINKDNTRIKITISKELYKDLKDIALYEGRSASNLAAYIIKQYINKRKINKDY